VAAADSAWVAAAFRRVTNNLASDGVHPNDQGYVYMANVWYAAIEDVLPE
jgi:lysophospholipase L1-like esterase